MKKIISLCLVFGLGISLVFAQKTEKVYSIVKVEKPHEFYVEQAELWWQEIEKNTTNEDAWYNYYKSNRYSYLTYGGQTGWDQNKKQDWKKESSFLKDLDEILKLIEKNIPNTYADLMLREIGNPGNDNMFQYLEKAYHMRSDDLELYDELITNDIEFDYQFTTMPKNATKIVSDVIERGYNRIAVFGGDGTVNEVLQGIMKNGKAPDKLELILIPAGSSCDFAKKYPNSKSNIELVLSNDLFAVDIGKIECNDSSGNPVINYFINIILKLN